MTKFMLTASLLAIISLSLPSIGRHSCKDDVVKYVQGGACEPGLGTEKHPYVSLAQAQADTSWDVLVVLPSSVPLDGGITLRDGTKLIGKGDPTSRIPCSELSIITNPTNLQNGGNGAIVNGKATIENIYFKDTFAAGIDTSLGKDVFIKNVLVTGHNKGNPSSVAGINGRYSVTGRTCIKHSVVRNAANTLGEGISDRTLPGVQRELIISKCEVSDLSNIGIIITSDGLNSSFSAVVEDSFIHDIDNNGCVLQTSTNSIGTALVKNSSFSNMTGDDIRENSFTGSSIDLHVCSSDFRVTTNVHKTALILFTFDSVAEAVFENCHISTLDVVVFAATSDSSIASTQKIVVRNNRATNMGRALFVAQNSSNPGLLPQTEVVIQDNTYVGRNGIEVLPFSPWSLLDIAVEHNCFTASTLVNSNGFFANPGISGTASIRAHHNTIYGFLYDIFDLGSTVLYQVQKNWWGPATVVCATNADCGIYQTCSGGFCLGPDNVVAGLGAIHANDPLAASIKCPGSCCHTNGLPILSSLSAEQVQQQPKKIEMLASLMEAA